MSSYATEATAQIYFDTRLNAEAWDDASSVDRVKGLAQATRIVDRLNFLGTKTVAAQENQFPRGGDLTIPEDVIFATCEISLALLDGVSPELEFENVFMTSLGYGGVRSSFDRSTKAMHILAGVPSFTAWTYLHPYLRDPHNMELRRS